MIDRITIAIGIRNVGTLNRVRTIFVQGDRRIACHRHICRPNNINLHCVRIHEWPTRSVISLIVGRHRQGIHIDTGQIRVTRIGQAG